MHMTDKELTIRQIGEFCTNTLCKKCPVAKWNEESGLHNGCMEKLKPCPFCGHSIDIEKDVYEPSMDWHPTFIDPDSGGDPINIHCKCGLEFCTGTHDWGEFVEAWNRRANDETD